MSIQEQLFVYSTLDTVKEYYSLFIIRLKYKLTNRAHIIKITTHQLVNCLFASKCTYVFSHPQYPTGPIISYYYCKKLSQQKYVPKRKKSSFMFLNYIFSWYHNFSSIVKT